MRLDTHGPFPYSVYMNKHRKDTPPMKLATVTFAVKVLAAFALVLAIVIATPPAAANAATVTPASAKPCASEDSNGPCYWDARTRGNHKGMSFYVSPRNVVIYDQRWTRTDGYTANNWTLVCPSGKHVAKLRWGFICR